MQFDPSGEGRYKSSASGQLERLRVPPSSSNFHEEREELEWVLRQPDISRSANLVRFLSFVCNKYFDGGANEIREYSIAVEALGRRESNFDSHVDPIVRVTAGALRKKLGEPYKGQGRDHLLQIVVPIGRYVPEFVHRPRASGLLRRTCKSDLRTCYIGRESFRYALTRRYPDHHYGFLHE